MYHMPMFKTRIIRSPDAGESNGGMSADAGDSIPAGDSTTSSAAPAAAAPEYLSKSDFEYFRNEITGHLQKLTPREQAKADAKDGKPAGPAKRPDPKDYDFQKDPTALQRYEDDSDEYRYQTRKGKEAEESKANEAKSRQEKSMKGHAARVLEYKKENPSFDEDIKKGGALNAEQDVVNAIVEDEEQSPAIVHYLAKNRGVLDELNQLALMGNTRAIDRKIGAIAAGITAERKTLEANAEAAADKIPRQNFSKGSKGADKTPTNEQRYADYRS